MRIQHPQWGLVEGTAAEIAALLQSVTTAGAAPTQTLLVPPGLRAPPSNEQLLHDYAQDVGLSVGERRRYSAVARDLEYAIAPKSLLDVTQDDIRAYERRHLDACTHKQFTTLAGRNQPPQPRTRCRRGEYAWTPTPPPTCATTCPLYARQTTGVHHRLKALRHLYEWLRERGLTTTNPVELVLRRHRRTTPTPNGPRRAAPTVTECRSLLRALADTATPRDVAYGLVLAKVGRRPDHVARLHATDLHLEGPFPVVDFAGVRERVLAKNRSGRTKLSGNLLSPIDADLHHHLVSVYLPWRSRHYALSPREGPLFPAEGSLRPLNHNSYQRVLDRAMRHLMTTAETMEAREGWRRRLQDARERLVTASFRHFFTRTLEDYGVSREARQTLRGDRLPDAIEHYRDPTPERLHRDYRMPNLSPTAA